MLSQDMKGLLLNRYNEIHILMMLRKHFIIQIGTVSIWKHSEVG